MEYNKYSEKKDANETFGVLKVNIENNNFKEEPVSLDSIKFDGKTIVSLCGNDTKSNNRAAFYSKCCLSWLDDKVNKDNITSYSIFYPLEQPLMTNFAINPKFNYDELANSLFEQIFTKDGKTQAPDEVAKNLSDVVFFGHSIGGFVMNELMYGLGQMMQERNFTDEDMRKVYQNIVFIAYSPYMLVAAPINHIYITPMYDSMGSTKLVYDRMIQVGNMKSSNPNFDIHNLCKFRATSYSNFLKLYETAMGDEDTIYFADHNALIATPNLLFNDGTIEDHNFAGVLNYPFKHPNKTKAGELTTKFIGDAFDYSLLTSRDKFSTRELFNQITNPQAATKENAEQQKENQGELNG